MSSKKTNQCPLEGFRALLLAGGFGTRLRPITNEVPKCLVPIGGKPLLEYWIDLLCQAGVEKILINTHYLANQVNEFWEKHPQRHQIELNFEPELLGTAGTLRYQAKFFGTKNIFLAHADNLTRFNVKKFKDRFDERGLGQVGTMMTFNSPTPKTCGIVTIDDRSTVINYVEKPDFPITHLANAAVFLLDSSIHDLIAQFPASVTDFCGQVVPQLLFKINSFHNTWYHRDIGDIGSYQLAQIEWKAYNEHYLQDQ